ncbi:hypothetical protein [Bradyrhizobium sp. sBnM-33]|uniref:hypothetical protein n=1 Tax=Bradyrhizobium sp. sBnM-33 TaxID=2831780 RepID=UPI001BCD39F8|nr:hypothetical protein [Bradyrhizobium sp. sBnM-33]WOH47849.1 hypothetical protein RX328_27285 [Bradyrhizobium sp. sBnM-33]
MYNIIGKADDPDRSLHSCSANFLPFIWVWSWSQRTDTLADIDVALAELGYSLDGFSSAVQALSPQGT